MLDVKGLQLTVRNSLYRLMLTNDITTSIRKNDIIFMIVQS